MNVSQKFVLCKISPKYRYRNVIGVNKAACDNGGFTLVELLTVIAILGFLLMLAAIGFGNARERALSAQSASNLRHCSTAVLLYLQQPQAEPFFRTGSGTGGRQWAALLVSEGYIEKDGRHVFSDPRRPLLPDDLLGVRWAFYTYGLNMIDTGTIESGDDYQTYRINLFNVINPATTFLLAETAFDRARPHLQIYRLLNYGGGRDRVQLRNNGKANIAFFDGRVEALGTKRLSEIGFTAVYDEQFNVISAK
jgi:prepilin-type N-terminal cleavage/methylation domain-containing protein/prepilin-type processing-associated H-X9-DG protein